MSERNQLLCLLVAVVFALAVCFFGLSMQKSVQTFLYFLPTIPQDSPTENELFPNRKRLKPPPDRGGGEIARMEEQQERDEMGMLIRRYFDKWYGNHNRHP